MRSMRLLGVSVFSFFLPYLILGSSDRSHNGGRVGDRNSKGRGTKYNWQLILVKDS